MPPPMKLPLIMQYKMEITRLAPFPLYAIQGDLTPNTDYIAYIYDDHYQLLDTIQETTNGSGVLNMELPPYYWRYDDEYRLEIAEVLGMIGDVPIVGDTVVIDTMTIMRPYVDPMLLADTPEDLEEAVMYESIARSIINSITGGFMYQRQVFETVGAGNDYLSVPYRLNKIVQVIENDLLVYDSENSASAVTNRIYYITPDKGAISIYVPPGPAGYDRLQSKPVVPPLAYSDSFTLYNTNDSPNLIQYITGSPMFPSNWDYVVVVETGWPVIPHDIKQATTLIVNDLKCNNIPYINSYIKDYHSDQFTLKFDAGVFKDTGNRIADKILSNYVRPIYRLGVL